MLSLYELRGSQFSKEMQGQLLWDVFLYAVNMCCSRCLVKKAALAVGKPDRVRWEIQAEIQEKGRV